MLNALLALPAERLNEVVTSLIDLLLEVAEESEIVSELVASGWAAIAAIDEDDRLESLSAFLVGLREE